MPQKKSSSKKTSRTARTWHNPAQLVQMHPNTYQNIIQGELQRQAEPILHPSPDTIDIDDLVTRAHQNRQLTRGTPHHYQFKPHYDTPTPGEITGQLWER